MARIPERVRGLYLVAPHGTLLATGEKRAVVKARKFKMAGEWLAILEDQRLLGVAKFKAPKALTLEGFRKTYDVHRVSREEREAWWKGKRKLWLYPVDEVYAYPSPIEYDVPPGTQIFLKEVVLPSRDKLVKVEPIKKLELRRFRAEGVDYDLEHPKARRAELQADLRYLAVGYDRLKRGLKWGDWTLEDVLRYFGTIVDTLREKVNPAYFPEPPAGDPKWKTNWWRCYKEAKEKGYLKTEPVIKGLPKPISSPGGKDPWLDVLLRKIPPHKIYVEPFAGGASLFWAKEPSEVEVLADINPDIVALYEFLQKGSDKDFAWIRKQKWTWSKEHFERLKGFTPRTLREKAYRYKYLNLFSIRGENIDIEDSERARSYSGSSFLNNLENYRNRLANVVILCEDAFKVIDRYDSPETFFYLDPPWKPAASGNEWKGFDGEDFRKIVMGLKGKVLISYQGDLDLGANFHRYTFERRGGGIAESSKQTLYWNYTLAKSRQAALGLVYRDGEILLIKRKNEPRVWSPPGGFLSGRDPVTAALEEVQEETGVLADPVMEEPWREVTVEGVRLYLIPMRWIKGKGEPLAEADEVGWFKLDDLPEPISPSPDILRAGQAIAKDGLGEAKLREMFEKLPDAFVVVPDWASLTGSAIYGKNRKPHDIDIVLRLDAPSGSLLKLERALKEAIGEGLPVQFSLESQGPTWAYLPLYTLVAVKNPEFEMRSLPEPGFAERFYKAAVQENISQIKPLEPVAHYKAAGEFYGGEEEELWEKWARRAVERGEKIAVQAKADGFRLHIHKKGSEFAVFTEKGLERSAAFLDFPKLIEKLPCRECILDVEAMAYKDSEWKHPQNRWEMAKNVCSLPYLERLKLLRKLIGDGIVAGKLKLAVMPTKVATGKQGLLTALKWADSQRQCNSEGAMLKFLSFKYDTGVLGGVVKYKTVPELDTLAIGWRKVPAGKPPHVHWTKEQAFKELPKLLEKSNTYIFRCALRSEEDPNLWLPLEGDHELSESDLKLDWDEEKQTWKGTDDPRYWTMLPGWPERKVGELAYGNTYACKVEDPSWLKKGLVITVRPAELRPFRGEDGKWHISWQHPLSPNPKEPGSPIGSVEAALRAYKLDPKDFQPLAWRKWEL